VTRWALALLCLLAPRAAPAQTAATLVVLDRLRDSLDPRSDTFSLRSLQRALEQPSRADDLLLFRRALVSLRLAQLGAGPDAEDALGDLRRLTRRRPEWAAAWHALAQAETHRAVWERSDPLALGSRVGTGMVERAAEHERRALDADPRYEPAALELARLTLDLRDTGLVAPARDALRRAANAGTPSGALLLALGRLERAAEDLGSAVAAFARVPANDPVAPLARLERARTQLAAGDSSAVEAYYAGAAGEDQATLAGYRADLAPIATDDELARFDRAHGEERAAFLRRFFTDRDGAELRAPGERVREHLRRLLYARRRFALTVARRYYGERDAYQSGSEELDDRGVIYVRHGDPATRLRPFVFGLMPNETWRYARADGDLLFHFSAGYDGHGGGDLYDYRLVESVLDLHGAADAPPDQLLLSRGSLAPVYSRMLMWGPHGAAHAEDEERAIGQASLMYGTSTDSYERQYGQRLAVWGDLVAVGRVDGSPAAQFVFAVGHEGAAPHEQDGNALYPIHVRVVTLDQTDHPVAAADSVFEFRLDRPLGPGQYLIGRVELKVPAGRWWWRAAIEESREAGAVLPRDSVQVDGVSPEVSGSAVLALSDLALGIRAASARWFPTPSDTVLLTPFDLFLEGSDVELYYETSGAAPGAPYRHQIAVYRAKDVQGRSPRPVVTLAVDERADATLVRSHRTLRLGGLKPGAYVVEVKVAGPGTTAAVRRRELLVVRAPH
jgi:GWxTD domain-containing protein